MFAKDHIHPLTVPTDKKCPLQLPRVTTADPQDLLEMRAPHVLIITHELVETMVRTVLNNWILCVLVSLAEKTTCIGWQMRLRVGVSPGLVFSGRRLSSRPSNIPLSLPALSLGPQLKNEWELRRRRADTRRSTLDLMFSCPAESLNWNTLHEVAHLKFAATGSLT